MSLVVRRLFSHARIHRRPARSVLGVLVAVLVLASRSTTALAAGNFVPKAAVRVDRGAKGYAAPRPAAQAGPDGLSHSDWSGILAAYEAGRHTVAPCAGGYQARNPGQHWQTRFDGRGFTVTPDAVGRGFTVTPDAVGRTGAGSAGGWAWGLELVSFGRTRQERAAGSPACINADGQRVEYEWDDALTEWYVNAPGGLEHGYTVQRRPVCGQNPDREGGVSSRPLLRPLLPESPLLRACIPLLQESLLTTDSRGPLVRESFLAPDPRESLPATPPATAPLRLTLAIRGDLLPRISPDGRNVQFVNASGAAIVNYSGLAVLDADHRSLPAYFESADNTLRITIDDTNARYPLTVDPIAQQAYLKASNTGGNDEFGRSVAISGDTVVVGANGEDSNATGVNGNQANNSTAEAGAAYVFVRAGTNWSQQAYLKASNTGSDDRFGWSVAISGDTLVVGAPFEASSATGVNGDQSDNSTSEAGAAYVFVRAGSNWSQQAYVKASNTGSYEYFGRSVAISGDTIVIGAEGEDSAATGVNGNQADSSADYSGAAYVFVRNGASWTQQAYLKASNTGAGDRFGHSVAISRDAVAVGAYLEDSDATGVNGDDANDGAVNSGAAYVFVRSGTSWAQQAYLKASNTGLGDYFGYGVAISAETAIVGALLEDSCAGGVNGDQDDDSATDSGAAYVFVRHGTTWSQQAYLKASNTGAHDEFGVYVAMSDDVAAVGAHREDSIATGTGGDQSDNSASNAGAAYVFTRGGAIWSQQAYLKASNTDAGDYFGFATALAGETLVVGGYHEASNATGVNGNQTNDSASWAGAAYIFTGLGPPPCPPCDTNCNGTVNQFDIQPFIDLLIPPTPTPCSPCAGDVDADGTLNQFDIQAFLTCLGG